jgi:2-C-methyl-D-erythritol 4-phosphate cytidylyltransferase
MLNYLINIFFYIKIIITWIQIFKIIYNKKTIKDDKINIGLILAGGTSTRFGGEIPKQLYLYKNIPLIKYSIESIINQVNYIIIIVNSQCYTQIKNIIDNELYSNTKIYLIINDINCRLESIGCGLAYIKKNFNNVKFVVIHDSARPFIPSEYIENMISNTNYYSQYGLKLTNGLMDNLYNTLDRDKYIELCSPICINFELSKIIYDNFINSSNRNVHEFIDILKILKIPIQIFYGKYSLLKKITYSDDLD